MTAGNRARRGKLPAGWVAAPAQQRGPAHSTARPPSQTVLRDGDGRPLMASGQPNPTGTGPYCPPRICWCGRCPWWRPAPPINYAAAIARLATAAAYLPTIPDPED